MKLIVFANNILGLRIVRWLKENDYEIAALVVHRKNAKLKEEIKAYGRESEIFHWKKEEASVIRQFIEDRGVELGVSAGFGYLIPPEITNALPEKVINLHTSLLPYNKGAYPNVWSIIDDTPAGVTIHYIDDKFDTGRIIAQKEVRKYFSDTGKILYDRLIVEMCSFFAEKFPWIVSAGFKEVWAASIEQPGEGTHHKIRDVDNVDEIELDKMYSGREIVNRLRARTFPPFTGCYVKADGKKIYISVEMEEE